MGLLSSLFGGGESIEESVHYEEEDEQADVDAANDALFDDNNEYEDTKPYGFYAPPKQKVWWRL